MRKKFCQIGVADVVYDVDSDHSWDQLREKVFVETVIRNLFQRDPELFNHVEIFIVSLNGKLPDYYFAERGESKLKVLIFLSDESGCYPTELLDNFDIIFKSYLPFQIPSLPIYPFSLGSTNLDPVGDKAPVVSRPIDVFFSGNLNKTRCSFYRELSPFFSVIPPLVSLKIIDILRRFDPLRPCLSFFLPRKDRWNISFTYKFGSGLSQDDYVSMLNKSRIVLCPAGFSSSETFRHSEALHAGAIVISERLPDNDLYCSSPILQVRNWYEGILLAESLLGSDSVLRALQKESMSYYDGRLSVSGVASYLLNTLRSHLTYGEPDKRG